MRTKIIFLLTAALLLFSVNQTIAATAWTEGDSYTFTLISKYEESIIDKDGKLKSETKIDNKNTITFVIDDIRSSENEIDLKFVDDDGTNDIMTDTFDPEIIGATFFRFYIYIDENGFITYFSFYFNEVYFIEPDFDIFNEEFGKSYDNLLLESATSNKTYEDILDESTVNFMGRDRAADASKEFNSDTKKWTFEADLAGVVVYSFYDDEKEEYIREDYTKYSIKIEIEYDTDGVLKSYSSIKEREFTTDYGTFTSKDEESFSQGSGGIVAAVPGFTLPVSIALLVAIPIIKRKEAQK